MGQMIDSEEPFPLTPDILRQNREVFEFRSASHFRKGRLEFNFQCADEAAVSFMPGPSRCVCSGPCGGCGSCYSSCIAIENGDMGSSI